MITEKVYLTLIFLLLLSNTETIEPEFEQVIHDNRWELYE